jgi:hypothetical protein
MGEEVEWSYDITLLFCLARGCLIHTLDRIFLQVRFASDIVPQ